MSKKENQPLNEIVKQIESLQTAIENLKDGIQNVDLETEPTYNFTHKQLVEFADFLFGNFKSFYGDEITGISFSDEVVQFDLDGNTIIPSIDSDMIASEIEDYVSQPTSQQLENMVEDILDEMEIK